LYHQKYIDYKNATTNKKLDHEFKLYTEQHTKDVLNLEKQVFYDKVSQLKADNQVMGRNITKDKYHNNREEEEKTRKRIVEEFQDDIDKLKDEIFKLQSLKEEEEERNADPALLKKQKESTMNLKQDHNKIVTDITVAKNRIKDLDTRKEILNMAIKDIL
jgi:hypothetical protein